jgi:uncharacterized protein YdbL (DUF1318 family)
MGNLVVLALLIGLTSLTAACRTHHEIEMAAKDPIRIDMNVRVDIYDHAQAIERMVSGGAPPPSFDTPFEEPADTNSSKPKASAADSGYLTDQFPLLDGDSLMVVAADEEVSKEQYDAALLRRQARFPKLVPLKKAGKIGENHLGLLTVRQPVNLNEKALVDQENKDRMLVYRYQAEERKATLRQVQYIFAKVQREIAKPGEWIEMPTQEDDPEKPWVWVQKK